MSISFIQIIFTPCSRCFCWTVHQWPNIVDIFNMLAKNCNLILFHLKCLHRVPRKNKSIIPLNQQSKTHFRKVTTIFSSTHTPTYNVVAFKEMAIVTQVTNCNFISTKCSCNNYCGLQIYIKNLYIKTFTLATSNQNSTPFVICRKKKDKCHDIIDNCI